MRLLPILCAAALIPSASADPASTLAHDQSHPSAYVTAARSILADNPSPESLAPIIKRITALFENARPPAIEHIPELAAACDLAILLHRTHPEAALPILKAHTADCLAAAKIPGSIADRFLAYAASFCHLRFASGDTAAADDYLAFLPSVDPDASAKLPALLRFLLSYPDDPKLAARAQSLFNGPGGEWDPIVGLKDRFYAGYTARDIYAEPLLWKHPAFRTQLLRLLADTTPVGELTTIDAESFSISITKGWTDSMTDPAWRDHLPSPGTKIPLRTCDYHALHAARQPGAPPFSPFFPTEERDAALAKLRTHFHP